MTNDRKTYFIDELKRHYQGLIADARTAETASAEAAEGVQTEVRRKEDARSAAAFSRMTAGHRDRRQRVVSELETLIAFASRGLPRLGRDSKVALGAFVDVSIEDESGTEERTLFVLPVGAGVELHGPGGDGFISVVTPGSPVGKALLGASRDDAFEIRIAGRDREWLVVDVS